MQDLFKGVYKNKTVLVTGHTGFKGSWLVYWLKKMGANVVGYSLKSQIKLNHSALLNADITSIIGDIRDIEKLNATFEEHKPDIVFHLAAQALVRLSYDNPIETYETNVIGTLKIFEMCKKFAVKSIINITSDKVYENKDWNRGYKENDEIGGYDPYSSSKGCAELLTASYRNSYFNLAQYKKTHYTLLATCRVGNVIGGGDWAKDRLMTDIILSVTQNQKIKIRNPKATRPWQHVLEPLSGYLYLGQKLLEELKEFSGSWNFGPSDNKSITVQEVVKKVKYYWDEIDYEIKQDTNQLHEANQLKLDSSKAHNILKWDSVWDNVTAFKKTIQWYKFYYKNDETILTLNDLERYIQDAKNKGLEWTKN